MAKKAKCMADGGIIGADGMTEAQRAKRNAALQSLGMSTAQPPVQAPPAMPQPVPVTPPAEPDRPRGIMGILGGRGKQIDNAAGYARGGIVRGKGGIDNVPMAIGGINVNLTGGKTPEAVLPGKTVMALGGPDAIESLIEATNGKPPVKGGLKEGGNYRYGANGEWIPDPEDDKAPVGGKWATPNMPIPVPSATNRNPMDIGNPVLSASNAIDRGMSAVGNVFADSASANREGIDYATARANRLAGESQPVPTQRPSASSQSQSDAGITSPSASISGITDLVTNLAGVQFMTGAKPGEMPTSAQGGFAQGSKSYNVNDTSQPGIQRVTSQGASPLYTNIKPEDAVSGLNNQTIGQPASEAAQGLERIANVNKIREAMNTSGGSGIMAPPGEVAPGMTQTEIDNAEKTVRWRQDELIRMLGRGRGSDAAIVAAIGANARSNDVAGTNSAQLRAAELQNQAARYGHYVNAQRDAERNNVVMRGQDINALSDRAKLSMLDRNDQRQAEKFALDKRVSEGALADSETQRAARGKLSQAIASGDPAAISRAHTEAVAAGLKFDREDKGMKPVEIADPTDKLGMRKILVQPNADGTYTPMRASANSPVPQGYSVVGTSGGKRVLQDAQGKRFVEGN